MLTLPRLRESLYHDAQEWKAMLGSRRTWVQSVLSDPGVRSVYLREATVQVMVREINAFAALVQGRVLF